MSARGRTRTRNYLRSHIAFVYAVLRRATPALGLFPFQRARPRFQVQAGINTNKRRIHSAGGFSHSPLRILSPLSNPRNARFQAGGMRRRWD